MPSGATPCDITAGIRRRELLNHIPLIPFGMSSVSRDGALRFTDETFATTVDVWKSLISPRALYSMVGNIYKTSVTYDLLL